MESTKLVVDLIKTQVFISSGAFLIAGNLLSFKHTCSIRGSLILFSLSIISCLLAFMRITGLIKDREARTDKNEQKEILIDDKLLRRCIGSSVIFCLIGGIFLFVSVW